MHSKFNRKSVFFWSCKSKNLYIRTSLILFQHAFWSSWFEALGSACHSRSTNTLIDSQVTYFLRDYFDLMASLYPVFGVNWVPVTEHLMLAVWFYYAMSPLLLLLSRMIWHAHFRHCVNFFSTRNRNIKYWPCGSCHYN